MAHVFIVDQTTFKYHLKYMFAGTGARDKLSPFLQDWDIDYPSTTERMLVGMIADISRIRINDKVVFYLQSQDGMPGMFFGVFRVSSQPFFDENDDDNYLADSTQKGLSFRVLLEPDAVYAKGVTEHEYLDSLQGKTSPADLCWSLIYRKLKGNRGCTMIMDYEFDDLLLKLQQKNNNAVLTAAGYSFDADANEIIGMKRTFSYRGRRDSLNILPRLIYKHSRNNAFESHLQAYIMQNCDEAPLRDMLIPVDDADVFIGNEVSCGVGMQRIDVMLKQETENEVYIRIIELKDEAPYEDIVLRQLPWYLEWLSDYVIPKYSHKKVILIPTVIGNGPVPEDVLPAFEAFSYAIPGVDVRPLEYIGFAVSDEDIEFNKYM